MRSVESIIWIVLAYGTKVFGANTPDYYNSICSSMFSTSSVNKCAPGERGGLNQTCLCATPGYLATIFTCLCENSYLGDVYPQGVKVSWENVRNSCPNAPSLEQMYTDLEKNPITQTAAQANVTGHGAFIFPPRVYLDSNTPRAGIAAYNGYMSKFKYGQALLYYVMGVVFLQVVINVLSWLFPSLLKAILNSYLGKLVRKAITMPALFNNHHAESHNVLGKWPLVYPQRLQTILIIGLYGCSAALLGCNIQREFSPFGVNDINNLLMGLIGTRAGFFGMYLFIPAFLFAGRNNFLIWATGWQHGDFLVWHKHLARLATLLIIVHAGAYTEQMRQSHHWRQSFKGKFIILGFVGLLSMGLMCFQAAKYFRARGYDIFVHIHIFLAIVAVAGIWNHLMIIDFARENLYAIIAVWVFDRLLRIVRMLYSGPFSNCEVKDYGDVLQLKVHFSNLWTPTGGSYAFLQFMSPALFTQSHPFTIVYEECEKPHEKNKESEQKGILKFYVKKRDGITKKIGERGNWKVMVDGPYGLPFNIAPYNELVFIAGGIGITGVYSHLIHALENKTGNLKCIDVYWSIVDHLPLIWFHDEIEKICSLPLIRLQIHISKFSGEPYHPTILQRYFPHHVDTTHRSKASDPYWEHKEKWDDEAWLTGIVQHRKLLLDNVVSDHIVNSEGSLCFFVCGPGGMCDNVRRKVSENITATENFVQFYEEAFAF